MSEGNDSYTVSLLHVDSDYADSAAGGAHTWTGHGNAQIDTSVKKFGAGSLLLDGDGDYIDSPDSTDWAMGSGDFTVDFWMKRVLVPHLGIIQGQVLPGGANADCGITIQIRSADEYRVSLLHMDGTNGGTVFTEDGYWPGLRPLWTPHGNAQLSTTLPKFGTACGVFDGNGDYIDADDSADWTMGAGDFTIDFWMKRGQINSGQYVMGQMNSTGTVSSCSFLVYINANNTVSFYVVSGSTTYVATSVGTITDTTTWHHIACVRDGNTLRLFIDGAADGTGDVTGITINDSAQKIAWGRVGEYNSGYFNGGLDEGSISKGIARWTSGFTPKTTAYIYDRLVGGFCSGATGYAVVGATDIIDTNWHHVALVRYGNILTLYLDGVSEGTVDVTGVSMNNSTGKYAIGREGEQPYYYFSGSVDENRISKGIARWISDFTPPTAAYSGDETVSLNLQSGAKTILAVSENTDQVLGQNLISGGKSLFSPSFVLDQILGQNLQSGSKTIFPVSNFTDQVLSQNRLEAIAWILSVLVSIDEILSVNLILATGFPYSPTATSGIIVDLSLLLAICSVLESSRNTDQILQQNILSAFGKLYRLFEQDLRPFLYQSLKEKTLPPVSESPFRYGLFKAETSPVQEGDFDYTDITGYEEN